MAQSFPVGRPAASRGLAAALALPFALAAAGCARLPPPLIADSNAAPHPDIVISPNGESATTTLDVLNFNIEGLAWPARKGRGPSLIAISKTISDLQARGKAPDVILIQEMFSRTAIRAVSDMGYPNIVYGPSRTQRKRMAATEAMPGPYRWRKGETGFHLASSGLAILSRYPIVFSEAEPFGRKRCAGLDCLSNKGMMHVRIAIPGVPEPIDLFNTHLNSQGASRVPLERHAQAHRLQVAQLSRFVTETGNADKPAILGGDFNMRHSALRFAWFKQSQPLTLVHQHCIENPYECQVRMSWDGDEPWMDTQDLQLFGSGSTVKLRPSYIEAMFDGAEGSPQLSDHDGFRVIYTLDWPTSPAGRRPAVDGTPVPSGQ